MLMVKHNGQTLFLAAWSMIRNSIQPTSDSGYIIAGWTKTYENPNQIYGGDVLLKLDSYGNQEWVQAYEGF